MSERWKRIEDRAAEARWVVQQGRIFLRNLNHLIHPKLDLREALKNNDPRAAQRALDMLVARQDYPFVPIPGEEALEIRARAKGIIDRNKPPENPAK